MALHRALDSLRDPDSLPRFLKTITRRVCARLIRQRRRNEHLAGTCLRRPRPARGADEETEARELELAALASLHAISPAQREVLVLHYLKGCSHREVAGFLGLTVTVVNNRLNAARKALRKETLKMVDKVFLDNSLPEDFADRVGRIVAVDQGVIDVSFDGEPPRDPHDVLATPDGGRRLIVIQRRSDGTLRCVPVSTEPLKAGEHVVAAVDQDLPRIPGQEPVELTEQLVPRPEQPPAMLETGIKSIDLLFPVSIGGRLAVTAPAGSGVIVLIEELCRRLKRRKEQGTVLSVFSFQEPLVFDWARSARGSGDAFFTDYREGNTDQVQTFVIPSRPGGGPPPGVDASVFDAAFCFDFQEMLFGRYPALDVGRSRSLLLERKLVGDGHLEIARRVRETLAEADDLMADPVLLRHLANRDWETAKQRFEQFEPMRRAALSAGQRTLVDRSQRLRCFLTTPFFAAETFTGFPARFVELEQTLRGFRAILDGELDDAPAERLLYIGALDEAR